MTWDEAKARCEAQSGQLGKGSIKIEKYMIVILTFSITHIPLPLN